MTKWQPIARALEESFALQAASQPPDNASVEENTKRLLNAVQRMYLQIVNAQAESTQCQHLSMNESAKDRAKIRF